MAWVVPAAAERTDNEEGIGGGDDCLLGHSEYITLTGARPEIDRRFSPLAHRDVLWAISIGLCYIELDVIPTDGGNHAVDAVASPCRKINAQCADIRADFERLCLRLINDDPQGVGMGRRCETGLADSDRRCG